MKLVYAAILWVAVLVCPAHAREYYRDPNVPKQFQRMHPCPSTGQRYGYCPGYIRDHVIPLCAGGADDPSNMQWQTVHDAHEKDKLEWQQCHVPERVWRNW